MRKKSKPLEISRSICDTVEQYSVRGGTWGGTNEKSVGEELDPSPRPHPPPFHPSTISDPFSLSTIRNICVLFLDFTSDRF